jgi:hypothetical protein
MPSSITAVVCISGKAAELTTPIGVTSQSPGLLSPRYESARATRLAAALNLASNSFRRQ